MTDTTTDAPAPESEGAPEDDQEFSEAPVEVPEITVGDPDADQEWVLIDPFGENQSKRFEVTEPFDLTTLVEAITSAVEEEDVQVAACVPDLSAPVSAENPAVIFVVPSSVDGRTVRGVLDTHLVPEPETPTEPAPEPPPLLPSEPSDDVADARDRLRDGETLSVEDLSLLLRAILNPPPAEPE